MERSISVRLLLPLTMTALALWPCRAPADGPAATAEADRILNLHVEALGGAAALGRIHSRRSEGSVERQGFSVPIVISQEAPNHIVTETRFPRPGTLKQGFDGATAWVLHPTQGGRSLEGHESAAFAGEAWLHPSLRVAEAYPVRRFVGQEIRGGTSVFVLAVGREGQKPETWCFEVATNRLVQIERRLDAGPQGDVAVVVRLEDYRAVDGVQVPFTVRTRLPQVESVLRLELVQHNVPFEAGFFRQPF